jgi:hypothetical protein
VKTDNVFLSVAASALIGLVQTAFLVFLWVFISVYTPVPHWLSSLGLRGAPHLAIQDALDFIVNVLLCLPAAFVISRLRPRKALLYLAVAVIPGFVWQYSYLFQHPPAMHELGSFVPGILSALLMLPVAALLVMRKAAHA